MNARPLRTPGILLGVGLGGFLDGILLHQLLQWHHMLTSTDTDNMGIPFYPADTVVGLRMNTVWDGVFHAVTWLSVLIGLSLLYTRVSTAREPAWRSSALWGMIDDRLAEERQAKDIHFPVEPDEAALAQVSRAAHALAYVVIASRRHTDLFEWGQRTVPFTLAAEIQRRLLPAAFTCEADSFTLSAWLEPAASIGGDTFDYSLARDQLHLSITDAVGHGVHSALTATLCVGSLRHTRRHGLSLLEQAQAANQALIEDPPSGFTFATGLLGRLDLRTGVLAMVNAGHPAPLLIRDGVVRPLALPIDRPFGVLRHETYRVTEIPLQPDDRLVLVTDGMIERDAEALDLPARLADLAGLHPREVVRVLGDTVLDVAGPTLPDDACLLVLDWRGGHGDNRSTTAGADPTLASTTPPGLPAPPDDHRR